MPSLRLEQANAMSVCCRVVLDAAVAAEQRKRQSQP